MLRMGQQHSSRWWLCSESEWMGAFAHGSHFCQLLSKFRNAPTYNGHLTKCLRTPKVIIALHEPLGFSKMNPQAIIL